MPRRREVSQLPINSSTQLPVFNVQPPSPPQEFRKRFTAGRVNPLLLQDLTHLTVPLYPSNSSHNWTASTLPHRPRRPGSSYHYDYSTQQRPKWSNAPSSPTGLGLCQVVTEFCPGPNVTWYCEKKMPPSKIWTYKKLIRCLIAVITIVFVIHQLSVTGFGSQITQAGFQWVEQPSAVKVADLDKEINYEINESEPVAETHYIVINSTLEDDNVVENVKVPMKEYVIYTWNEDFETTVEVVE